MDASERLKVAGDATVLIEDMNLGLTAVARLRDGVVTLECWGGAHGRPVVVRHVVQDEPAPLSARQLADLCAAEMRAVMTEQGAS